MAADEIDRFRREIVERTGDRRAADSLTDQELLREVMNTVGRQGRLGGSIRCVVSVSMLTEGWDANTVTHVLGVRAFGTQLLCEQVIGRALRRQSYDLNEDGKFNVEYADVLGIPFDFTAKPVVAPLFHLTYRLLYTKWRDAGEAPKLHLFGQLKRITREWLDNHLECKGGTYPAQLIYQELADMACNRITAGITAAFAGERPIKAVLDSYNPVGSTAHVRFNTSRAHRWQTDPARCHVNWVVLDSDWEAELCRVAESHPRVKAYVKNHSLGLEVPYRYGSEMRRYLPDFIVLVDDGHGDDDLLHLVVEIKGYRRQHWAQGGPTTLSNLALLCRRHHRAVHEEGYQVDRQPDGALHFRRPDGRLLPEVPPPAPVPADPVQALRAQHDAQGLRLHARTACPSWLGERLDVGYAIDVLHPLARRGVGRG